jgi:peptidoglycan/xylan/chitin deacetylase (PgdA/CDA1 family)
MPSHTSTIHRFLFPSIVWKMNSPAVFLTFDDGPHPAATPAVLEMLQRYKIKGTFFMSGLAVKKYPSLVKEVEAEHHNIGIHAFNHVRSIAFSKSTTMSEILQTEEAITEAGAQPAKIFRPPYGFFTWNTISAAKELNYKLVMWTTSTGDYRRDWSDDQVCATALTKLTSGAILVFHDNELTKSRVRQVLPRVITGIQERGLAFGLIQ